MTSAAMAQPSPSLLLLCSRLGTLQEAPGTVTLLERDAPLRLLRKTMRSLVTDEVIMRTSLLDGGKVFTAFATDPIAKTAATLEALRLELLCDPHTARILAERAQPRHSGAVATRGELPS